MNTGLLARWILGMGGQGWRRIPLNLPFLSMLARVRIVQVLVTESSTLVFLIGLRQFPGRLSSKRPVSVLGQTFARDGFTTLLEVEMADS